MNLKQQSAFETETSNRKAMTESADSRFRGQGMREIVFTEVFFQQQIAYFT